MFHGAYLTKPRDANRWSSGRIFLSHPHTRDAFLYVAEYGHHPSKL